VISLLSVLLALAAKSLYLSHMEQLVPFSALYHRVLGAVMEYGQRIVAGLTLVAS
jgi:hypothetical protein